MTPLSCIYINGFTLGESGLDTSFFEDTDLPLVVVSTVVLLEFGRFYTTRFATN